MKYFIKIIMFTIIISGQLYAADKPLSSITTRYALIVGADNAGSKRPSLKYSRSDAKAVKQLFHEIGGLKYSNSQLLLNPNFNDQSAALNIVSTEILEVGIKADITKQWATRLNLEIILGFPTVTSETGPYGEVIPFKARELAMLSFDIICRFNGTKLK